MLTAELNETQSSVLIRWSINVDSSIHSLTGTRIIFYFGESETYYRCQYQPPFTSRQISLIDQDQLWFNFTVPNVPVCPSTSYDVTAYNLPTPSEQGKEYGKKVQMEEVVWTPEMYSVLHGDKIMVSFKTSPVADRYVIQLSNGTHPLKTVTKGAECKVAKCVVELEYMENMGPCEELVIKITSHFEHCRASLRKNSLKVVCPKRSYLDISVGCVLALLFVILCCCIIYSSLVFFQRARGSRRAGSVRVLLVYPAVDGVFQRSVMLLAERLQSSGNVSVIIDVWERGHLAEQGPLRWFNSKADLADRVLIISPPPHTQTDDLKSKLFPALPDDAVSASASNLFALALNLVTSTAHDPRVLDKFWVIILDHNEKSIQTELRGCRMFVLPRDFKKLHRQLSEPVQSPAQPRCFRTYFCKQALEQL
ncbi:uncharacterized protein LOC122335507 isoform X2 [Puntigrus tetrazona]|nr:uncharacterized protein LOC122335507 isoform X2 [Puntigrus tetrazona]